MLMTGKQRFLRIAVRHDRLTSPSIFRSLIFCDQADLVRSRALQSNLGTLVDLNVSLYVLCRFPFSPPSPLQLLSVSSPSFEVFFPETVDPMLFPLIPFYPLDLTGRFPTSPVSSIR